MEHKELTRPRLHTRAVAVFVTAFFACGMLPTFAFAEVSIDGNPLSQGENAVGEGTATLSDTVLDMVNVVADTLYSDEDLSVNFNGGNDIENVNVSGSANVDLNFTGANDVEEVHASGASNVTINTNGQNDFEEIHAFDQSNLTINVTGKNNIEEIVGKDDANITVRGAECQRRAIINMGEGEEDTEISVERGSLSIDHVTVNLKGEEAYIGSASGGVSIDTAKIAKDDGNEYTFVTAGSMKIRESVIDISGTIRSTGDTIIDHSDVKIAKPDSKYDDESPYRLYSETGIKLIREKNGEVEQGTYHDKDVWYVDTDDNDGEDVDLKADGKPAYYKCSDDSDSKAVPKTGDDATPFAPLALALLGIAIINVVVRRRATR